MAVSSAIDHVTFHSTKIMKGRHQRIRRWPTVCSFTSFTVIEKLFCTALVINLGVLFTDATLHGFQ